MHPLRSIEDVFSCTCLRLEFHQMKVPSWEVEWLPEWVAGRRCGCYLGCWVLLQVLINSWVRTEGFCRREVNSWHFLVICLVNSFHCFYISPNDTWAMIIQEWWVWYAFNKGWNSTDSLFSCVVLTSVIMHAMLERRWVQVIYRWLCTGVKFWSSIGKCDNGQAHRMVDVSSCSATLCANVP